MATLKQLQGRDFDPVAFEKALGELAKLHPPGRSARAGRRDDLPELPELPDDDDDVVVEFRKR
jgi:hypothetical protein